VRSRTKRHANASLMSSWAQEKYKRAAKRVSLVRAPRGVVHTAAWLPPTAGDRNAAADAPGWCTA
jgi:hypothetical protein